ncbi:hypothetical protein HK098_008374 [Nowakowskiella sp. JEL0407]|nr:hypothetical protein HK098_008374 [Nowakowskiella sp. JEL0407]
MSSSEEEIQVIEEEIIPCENFNMVCKGIYRSAFPKKKNFPFLKKLGLNSILTLILEDYPEQNKKFLEENNIKLFQFGVAGNKVAQSLRSIFYRHILKIVMCLGTICGYSRGYYMCGVNLYSGFSCRYQVLIHCNKGKHRTGCLVGCTRKMQHWSLTSIFDEYRRFSSPKSRSMDQQFIELFDVSRVVFDLRYLPDWPELSFSELVLVKQPQITHELENEEQKSSD